MRVVTIIDLPRITIIDGHRRLQMVRSRRGRPFDFPRTLLIVAIPQGGVRQVQITILYASI